MEEQNREFIRGESQQDWHPGTRTVLGGTYPTPPHWLPCSS